MPARTSATKKVVSKKTATKATSQKKTATKKKSASKKTSVPKKSTAKANTVQIYNAQPIGDPKDYRDLGNGIYWIGIDNGDPFHCNPYLIVDKDEAVIVDPGGLLYAEACLARVKQITPLKNIKYIIAHHQDPDVCSAVNAFRPFVDPECKIVCHSRMSVLIKHFGAGFDFYEVDKEDNILVLNSGRQLTFAHTPYLHSPGAIVTYDIVSKSVFTADLFGGVGGDWKLIADTEDFYNPIEAFHSNYMPSIDILNHGLEQIKSLGPIKRLLPQHGSILEGKTVEDFTEKLEKLNVGMYADKAFEDRLKNQQQAVRMHQLVENASIKLMAADENGTIIYINPAAAALFKKFEDQMPCTVDEMIGKPFDIFHKNPAYQKEMLRDHKNAFPRQRTIEFGQYELQINAFGIYDHDGTFMGPAVIWEDITEQNKLAQRDQDVRQRISSMANSLTDNSHALKDVSLTMSSAAEETSAQANGVSESSISVAKNINQVVAAIEEMSASVSDIAKNSGSAKMVASDAVSKSTAANTIVSKLGESSAEIGKVIKVISSIAQQTNLLALNATIEAARAGDMGRGFGVVANAIKDLSKETSASTDEITEKIEKIQTDSKEAVNSISEITDIISKINDYSAMIASAVEEQSITSNEISKNMSMAANGVDTISNNISSVAEAASNTSKGATGTLESANKLSELSQSLQQIVSELLSTGEGPND